MQSRTGFTLVELSIVLVIIGLITGGVLVGRDLIEAAKIRQQITQIECYKTAVQTFRTKYNGLPGDLNAGDAAAFGFTPRSGTPGHGNGNGILEYCNGTASANLNMGCELVLFWRDLSDAGLIEGSFTTATDAPVTLSAGQTNNVYVPDAKIGSGISITVFSMTTPANGVVTSLAGQGPISCGLGSVCYALIGLSGMNAGAYVAWPNVGAPNSPGLTALQAFAIDNKIDDGFPGTGTVYGGTIGTSPNVITPSFRLSASNCLTGSLIPGSSPVQYTLVYATNSETNIFSPGYYYAPDRPSCMLNVSGQ